MNIQPQLFWVIWWGLSLVKSRVYILQNSRKQNKTDKQAWKHFLGGVTIYNARGGPSDRVSFRQVWRFYAFSNMLVTRQWSLLTQCIDSSQLVIRDNSSRKWPERLWRSRKLCQTILSDKSGRIKLMQAVYLGVNTARRWPSPSNRAGLYAMVPSKRIQVPAEAA